MATTSTRKSGDNTGLLGQKTNRAHNRSSENEDFHYCKIVSRHNFQGSPSQKPDF